MVDGGYYLRQLVQHMEVCGLVDKGRFPLRRSAPSENISFSAGVKWQGETTLIYHPAYLHVLNKLMQMMTAISPMNSRSTA